MTGDMTLAARDLRRADEIEGDYPEEGRPDTNVERRYRYFTPETVQGPARAAARKLFDKVREDVRKGVPPMSLNDA